MVGVYPLVGYNVAVGSITTYVKRDDVIPLGAEEYEKL